MPAARAPRQGAHAPAPPPGPGGSLHLSLPGYSGRRCKANFGKSFRGETLALKCPALRFPTSGGFPENVAKKLSRWAEENARSRREDEPSAAVFFFLLEVGVPWAPPHG